MSQKEEKEEAGLPPPPPPPEVHHHDVDEAAAPLPLSTSSSDDAVGAAKSVGGGDGGDDDIQKKTPWLVNDWKQELQQRRPDRISITIHREHDTTNASSSDELGIILDTETGVITGLHKEGLLILASPTIMASSSSSSSSEQQQQPTSVLQIGDTILRVNGVPWNVTVAKDIIQCCTAIGTMVFDIGTATTTTNSSCCIETNNNSNNINVPGNEHCLAEQQPTQEKGAAPTSKADAFADASNGSILLEDAEGEPQTATTTTPSEKNPTKMTMIHQAIIILPDSYTGDDCGLPLRPGRRRRSSLSSPATAATTVWTGRTLSDIWKFSAIGPNQQVVAIQSHFDIPNVDVAMQYLQQGLLLQRQLAVTTIAPASSSWTMRKTLVGITGGAIVSVGAVLFVSPLHPIGHAMVIGGATVLSTEFDGPQRALLYTKEKLAAISKNRLFSFRKRQPQNGTTATTNGEKEPAAQQQSKPANIQ